jgi:outer membrane immunogenic protein
MNRLFIGTISLICLGNTAFAADMPAAVPVNPGTNWTGFYIGAMGGYGFSNEATVAGVTGSTTDVKGPFAGGTLGYNFQIQQFVIGVENDAAWSDMQYNASAFGISASDRIESFGSVTARLGVAVGPALLYGKGGYAWANNQIAFSGFGRSISETQFHNGFTIGGGLEYMMFSNVSAKVEYMYADYLDQTYTLIGNSGLTTNTIKAGVNVHF